MGTIFDLNDPTARPAPRRARARKRRRYIELDTPILPRVVADGVLEEVRVWPDAELPREWVKRLAARANLNYTRNARFRRFIQSSGNTGLDLLWALMRHWLAARLRRFRPELYARLPASYAMGAALPERPRPTG